MVALVFALLYNWPLKFTVFSVVPYLVSFACLAAFVALCRPGSSAPPWWLVAAGGLLGGGAHFVNVLPDLADDAETGVRGLPHRIGRGPSIAVAAVLLLAATGLLAFAPARPRGGWRGWRFAAAAVALLIGLAGPAARIPGRVPCRAPGRGRRRGAPDRLRRSALTIRARLGGPTSDCGGSVTWPIKSPTTLYRCWTLRGMRSRMRLSTVGAP